MNYFIKTLLLSLALSTIYCQIQSSTDLTCQSCDHDDLTTCSKQLQNGSYTSFTLDMSQCYHHSNYATSLDLDKIGGYINYQRNSLNYINISIYGSVQNSFDYEISKIKNLKSLYISFTNSNIDLSNANYQSYQQTQLTNITYSFDNIDFPNIIQLKYLLQGDLYSLENFSLNLSNLQEFQRQNCFKIIDQEYRYNSTSLFFTMGKVKTFSFTAKNQALVNIDSLLDGLSNLQSVESLTLNFEENHITGLNTDSELPQAINIGGMYKLNEFNLNLNNNPTTLDMTISTLRQINSPLTKVNLQLNSISDITDDGLNSLMYGMYKTVTDVVLETTATQVTIKIKNMDLTQMASNGQRYYFQNLDFNEQKCDQGQIDTLCSSCADVAQCDSCLFNYSTDSKCQSCETGSYLTIIYGQNYCQKCPENCKTCISNAKCLTCQESDIQRTGDICDCPRGTFGDQSNQCKSCNTNCKTCSSFDKCTQCGTGYRPDSSGSCVSCNPNCTSCSENTCYMCDQGYEIKNYSSQCELKCALNCDTCVNGNCRSCNYGYKLDKDKNVCISTSISNDFIACISVITCLIVLALILLGVLFFKRGKQLEKMSDQYIQQLIGKKREQKEKGKKYISFNDGEEKDEKINEGQQQYNDVQQQQQQLLNQYQPPVFNPLQVQEGNQKQRSIVRGEAVNSSVEDYQQKYPNFNDNYEKK